MKNSEVNLMSNKNESLQWMLAQPNFSIDLEILDVKKPIRGIYGIFVEEKCVYVGRSENIYKRMFSTVNAHIRKMRRGEELIKPLRNAIVQEKEIEIKILKKVNLVNDSYNKDMHRLAMEEYKFITEFQNKDQCLWQLPDGSNMKKTVWEAQKAE